MPARRIAVCALKGGVGKSSTATAVAVSLARRGRRTLLVDCDQSGNASWILSGGQGIDGPTLADVLTRHASAEEAIRPSAVEGLDLLPASSALGGVNVALAQELARDTRLRSALAAVEDEYAVIVADTGPSFTTILANTLVWAREILMPVDPGIFAVLGLVELQATMEEVKEAYGNHELHVARLVLCRVARNNTHRDVERSLRERYGELVAKTTIPLAARVEEAHTNAQTIVQYAPHSPAARAYGYLVDELEGLSDGRTTEDGRGVAPGKRSRKSGDAA
jgi:chromosome partitioning protein